ncbi:uncharacterized protein LOC117698137 isoform X2 [Arvicanthis niloticus]|uniref:uncharacterized protein LOC117698137 isoform X2 n=1 Tax=Arvicanthis niloticus TaxID=61156 RepID=UPI00402BEE20
MLLPWTFAVLLGAVAEYISGGKCKLNLCGLRWWLLTWIHSAMLNFQIVGAEIVYLIRALQAGGTRWLSPCLYRKS